MTERELKLIEALSNAPAPSGFEEESIAAVRGALAGICDIAEDSLRNLYVTRRRNTGDKPLVMLDAHGDEVGFMIHSIRPEGTLRFVNLGGWNKATLPGTQVLVRNRTGQWIPGVIAARPPHFMSAEEKARQGVADYKDLVIDVGACSDREAQEAFGIRIGEPAVPAARFSYDAARDVMHGKAFDCRIGCAALAEVMRRLAEEDLAVDVVGVISSQEEVGERGCAVAAEKVAPDIAIVFEGCPADDTVVPEAEIQTAIHRGPMLRHIDARMITNPRYQRFALDLADALNIPVQEGVRVGGSTNGASIHLSNQGVPTIVIGLPVRYIHSHYGIASHGDFLSAVRLACGIIRRLDAETIRSF